MTANYFWKGGLCGRLVAHRFRSEPNFFGFCEADYPEVALRLSTHEALVDALQALLEEHAGTLRALGIMKLAEIDETPVVVAARAALAATETRKEAGPQ